MGFWISICFFLMLISGVFLANRYLPYLIKNKISQLVVEGSDSLYKCSIGNVSVNFWLGKVSIENICITVDSVKYFELQKKGKLPNITFEINLKKASISKFKILPLLLAKKIFIDTMRIDRTDLIFCFHPNKSRQPHKPEKPLWLLIKPIAKGVYINNLVLNNIKLAYSPLEDKQNTTFSYQDGSISLQNIRIDSIGAGSRSRILYTENIAIKLAGIRYHTPDSLYLLNIDTFGYSSVNRKLELKLFDLKPSRSLVEFTKRVGMQVDVFDIVIPELVAYNFRMERIFTDNEISIDSILLKRAVVKISRDRTAHYDTASQIGKYPNEALLNAPVTIRIPMVLMEEGEFHYIERQKLTLKTGDGYFTRINGFISNITNSKRDIEENRYCKANLNGLFMNRAKLTLQMDFDMGSTDGNYIGSAHLGSITSNELNPLFIPFANASFKSFTFNEGYVKFMGNKHGIVGSSRLLYDDLNIELLSIDKKTHKTKKQGFISFFANLVAIRAHNKAGKNEVMADNIYVKRKGRQPFGNLMWELLFESIKKIVLKVPAKNLKAEM